METKQSNDTQFFDILMAMFANSALDVPPSVSKDGRAGILYALSTLEENEQRVLLLRYGEKKTVDEIASAVGVSQDEVSALEAEAIRKLRLPGRWNYIRHGVNGYMRKRIAEEHQKAYQEGYCDGYQKGLQAKENTQIPDSVLDMPVESMGLPHHALTCLRWVGKETLREVAEMEGESILRIRGMGPGTAAEIALALRSHGVEGTAWDRFLPLED